MKRATLAITTLMWFVASVGAAQAVTYTVTRTDDPAPGTCDPSDCSLREAVNASNGTTTVDDVVVLPALGDYSVTAGTITFLDQAELRGAGADKVAIDANEQSTAITNNSTVLTISGVSITGGLGGAGGIQNNGTLTLRQVSIHHNTGTGGGGGVQSNGALTIDSSFIGFNSAFGAGGGIQSNAALTITNSTIDSNRSSGGPGAIQSNAATSIASSAVIRNEGTVAGGVNGSLTLRDTILARNRITGGAASNCNSAGTSQGGNVEDADTCGLGATDRRNTDPGLGPLDLHGGTTPVQSLLTGSAAIDAGAPTGCPATDQRGAARPQGAACDSGPFETTPPASPPPPAADLTPPQIWALSLDHPVFRSGRGARFLFALSEDATVSFDIRRLASGRRVGGACRRPTRANRTRPRCTRSLPATSFSSAGALGENRVKFSGRNAAGRRLPAGRYRATLQATDAAGNHSATKTLKFRITRR